MRSKTAVFCSSVVGINFCSAPLCSVGLGLAGAFELAWPRCALDRAEPNENEPTRTSQAYPETLRRAGPWMLVALRPRSASLGRSNRPLEPARPRWGALPDRAARKRTEPDRSSLLGDASLGRTTDACCTQHRDEHSLCIECTGMHESLHASSSLIERSRSKSRRWSQDTCGCHHTDRLG